MNRLKELRKERNFKMTQMAEFLGVPYTTYVGYEKGERRLLSETLTDFSKKLGVSIDYILCLTDEKMPTVQQDNGHEKEILDFMQTVDQLDQKNLATLKDIALSLLKRQSTQGEQ